MILARPSQRGFALLITITLLAFLVLLLVSLASLTRVETQVAGNAQTMNQARQNALMALNIAIGQLQKYAGPDQRVTAGADLAGDASGNRLVTASGSLSAPPANNQYPVSADGTRAAGANGLVGLQQGTRYWTGVWGNFDKSTDIYKQTPAPVLLTWLVSGNESATFAANTAGATPGNITTSSVVTPKRPNSPAAPIATTTATPGGGDTMVLLAGAHTVGDPASDATARDRYVVAPLVDITSAQVPGLTGSQTIGRYAWWVGDEGVKAKYNLIDSYAVSGKTDASTQIEARYRLLAAPRAGVELLTGFANYPQPPVVTHASLAKILSLDQAGILDSALTSSAGQQALLGAYHDLTTCSLGLLTDSQRGGLRKDLTALLGDSSQFDTFAHKTSPYTSTNGRPVIEDAYSPKLASNLSVPQWDVVKSFYDLSTEANTGSVEIRATTDTQMGISPIISQVRLLFGMRMVTATPSSAEGSVVYTVNPLVILANPYPVTLTAPAGSVTIEFSSSPTNGSAGAPQIVIDGATATVINNNVFSLLRQTNAGQVNQPSLLTGVVFSFPSISIPPGEARSYFVNNIQTITTAGSRSVQLSDLSGYPSGFPGAECPVPAGSFKDVTPYTPVAGNTGPRIELLVGGVGFSITADLERVQGTGKIGRLQRIERNEIYNTAWNGANGFEGSGLGQDGAMPRINAGGGWRHDNTFPIAQYTMQMVYPDQTYAGYSSSLQGYIKNISTRTLQDFNLRTASAATPGATPGVQSNVASTGGSSVAWHSMPPYFPYYATAADIYTPTRDDGNTAASIPTVFTADATHPLWGQGNKGTSTTKAVLFDLPRANLASGEIPLFSIGQLQHVNLSADDQYNNAGHQPGYIVGGSYATPFVSRNLTVMPRDENGVGSNGNAKIIVTYLRNRNFYDMSYRENASLWDQYYFSTVPRSGVTTPLNKRLVALPDPAGGTTKQLDYAKAGEVLAVDGAFNVNSTSVAAWTAVLGGTKSLPQLPDTTEDSSLIATTAVYPRGIWQPGVSANAGTITHQDAYNGFRRLTTDQVSALAKAIVKQVRLRGPFISFSHFVNRTLIAESADTTQLGLSGALQSAIDAAGLNSTSATDKMTIGKNGVQPLSDRSAQGQGVVAGELTMYADTALLTTKQAEQGYRSTSIPGWLTQGDILQMLGPVLSARSDTFTIRTYGEVRNPLGTATDAPISRAWCEAVVQRMPQYVDTTDTAEKSGAALTKTINQQFGRAFRVVSFRWLSPDDI